MKRDEIGKENINKQDERNFQFEEPKIRNWEINGSITIIWGKIWWIGDMDQVVINSYIIKSASWEAFVVNTPAWEEAYSRFKIFKYDMDKTFKLKSFTYLSWTI